MGKLRILSRMGDTTITWDEKTGAAEAVREAAGADVYGYYKPDEALREQSATSAQVALGNDAYDDAVDVGRSLTPDDAISYALAEIESPRVA